MALGLPCVAVQSEWHWVCHVWNFEVQSEWHWVYQYCPKCGSLVALLVQMSNIEVV